MTTKGWVTKVVIVGGDDVDELRAALPVRSIEAFNLATVTRPSAEIMALAAIAVEDADVLIVTAATRWAFLLLGIASAHRRPVLWLQRDIAPKVRVIPHPLVHEERCTDIVSRSLAAMRWLAWANEADGPADLVERTLAIAEDDERRWWAPIMGISTVPVRGVA